jgi:hypothetical protein
VPRETRNPTKRNGGAKKRQKKESLASTYMFHSADAVRRLGEKAPTQSPTTPRLSVPQHGNKPVQPKDHRRNPAKFRRIRHFRINATVSKMQQNE